MLSTVGGVAALVAGGGAILLRRRVSRDWIARSSVIRRDDRDRSSPGDASTTIVTGGNVGLGYAAAMDLAGLGRRIVLACRDVDAGERAAAAHTASARATTKSFARGWTCRRWIRVRSFAAEMSTRDRGVRALGRLEDEDRGRPRDPLLAWNPLGHFKADTVAPASVERSGIDGRIVIVSLDLVQGGKIDSCVDRDFVHDGRVPDEGEKRSFAPTGYCDSKLMNMLTCRELAVRLRGSTITTYAVSPGFCRSQLGRNVRMPLYKKALAAPIMRLFQRSAEQGALNIVHAVIEDKEALESGAMYQDGKIWDDGVKLVETLGDDLQKGLWEISEELIKEKKRNV
ncbi:hypothetical protein ACHAW5_009398 [Stephanodiscus triporus]|uniref:Protochlorophyllide reductase n=1 Tax=Stephanodiscus triporus TaxID=2934178 RepID=A0ABD3PLE8_9STRA